MSRKRDENIVTARIPVSSIALLLWQRKSLSLEFGRRNLGTAGTRVKKMWCRYRRFTSFFTTRFTISGCLIYGTHNLRLSELYFALLSQISHIRMLAFKEVEIVVKLFSRAYCYLFYLLSGILLSSEQKSWEIFGKIQNIESNCILLNYSIENYDD